MGTNENSEDTKMKIKYIGNFNDGTGWAKASTYNALALDAAGYDVCCEEMKYNNANINLENRINELINKSGPFDYTIQHVLPTDYVKYKNTINIGVLSVESTISNISWIKNMNMMDMIFVSDIYSKKYLESSGVKTECRIFEHSLNYDKIKGYEKTISIPQLQNYFNFVFVGEFSARKDLENVVKAFHGEFDYTEPVNLFIKTNTSEETLKTFLSEIKRRLKKPGRLKEEILVVNYLNEQDLMSIMSQCHCFVTSSHGEAWCYPAAEAMAIGLSVIYPKNTGIEMYAKSGENYPLETYYDFCYGATDSVDGLYTCEDMWVNTPNIELRKGMRKAFLDFVSSPDGNKTRQEKNSKIMKEYDYRNNKITRGLFT